MSEKSTRQHQVAQALASAAGPRSANELWEELRDSRIGIATIYRALKSGVASGEFVAIELPGGPIRYEPAGRRHHHHFLCSACQRAFDISGNHDGLENLLPRGFSMAGHEILLFGTCAECQAAT